ncbi:hypothetical protein GYMLUDRAFT_64137 [Collybiopsis luxurians FD-317 M1]|uniref:Uncharacterized protein n=1 Tax=Collybiopsis luxurians FD-317 M1 TaxID=944289 RepID=A0A0D0CCH1_9AGAR|nr:hypothetical protein GYMLUDRAFT_64137 [Collybiopsis luxurians FD-317 M1]
MEDENENDFKFDIPLISEIIRLPMGILATRLSTLGEDVKCWFLTMELPLPPCMANPDASPLQPKVDDWMEQLHAVAGQKAQCHWKNLTSGKIELYALTIAERNEFRNLEIIRKLLSSSFHDTAELCNVHGYSFVAAIVSKQQLLFRNAGLVFLAMNQGLERTINSWQDTHPQIVSTILDQVCC